MGDSFVKIYKRIINSDLAILSDRVTQEKLWVKEEGKNASCFDEIIGDFLYDLKIIINSWQEYGLKKEQKELLSILYKKLEKYYDSSPISDKELIMDPKWDEIRLFAREVYETLKKK